MGLSIKFGINGNKLRADGNSPQKDSCTECSKITQWKYPFSVLILSKSGFYFKKDDWPASSPDLNPLDLEHTGIRSEQYNGSIESLTQALKV